MRTLLPLLALCGLLQTGFGKISSLQSSPLDTLPVNLLDSVVVQAARLPGPSLALPLSSSRLDTSLLQSGQSQLNLEYALSSVPGVFVLNANNYAQDVRISMRGFGARAAFGIRGIKILVDGIPQSTPDGQGQVDNIDLGVVENLEVIRGPASGLYGNASGGVISLSTESPPQQPYAEAGATVGSFGLQRYQIKGGLSGKRLGGIVQGSYTRLDGFRPQNRMRSRSLNTRLRYKLSGSSKLQFLFGLVDSPLAEDPGSLNRELLSEDRKAAWPANLNFDAGESVQQGRTALLWNHQWDDRHQLQARLFYQWRDFNNRLPFEAGGIVRLQRNFIGAGVKYGYQGTLASLPYRLRLGVDAERQADYRQRFNNRQGTMGIRSLAQDEIFENIGLFAIQEWEPHSRILLLLALRLDLLALEAEDRFLLDGDDSGRRTYHQFNPSIGLHYQLWRQSYLYTNYTRSFETPALSELTANPAGGGFNQRLSPQRASNLELGWKSIIGQQWKAQLAAYYIWLEDELVPFELPLFPGRVFFRNAGQSERWGLEASLSGRFNRALSARLSYTYAQYTYQEYETPSSDFAGNQLPGIPAHLAALLLNYRHQSGISLQLQNRYVGELYTDDANTVTADAYFLANLRIQYRYRWQKLVVSPFIGLNNITDAPYNDNIRINAFGGRYFEPAPGINWYGGLSIRVMMRKGDQG